MKTILRQHTITLIIAFIAMVASLVCGGFILARLTSKVNAIGDIKQRIASYQKNKKAFTDEVTKIQILEKRVSVLESSVVTTESVPVLLSSLESLGKASGVTFEITSVQTPVENDISSLLIDCSIVGSRAQILSFLAIIQHQSFAVTIPKLFVFSEEGQQLTTVSSGVLQAGKSKAPTVIPEKQWHAVATLKIVSF